jgi:hypothetical protein
MGTARSRPLSGAKHNHNEEEVEMRYMIRCTPGGLLKDEESGNPVTFANYAEAQEEAQRMKQDPRFKRMDFTPVEATHVN